MPFRLKQNFKHFKANKVNKKRSATTFRFIYKAIEKTSSSWSDTRIYEPLGYGKNNAKIRLVAWDLKHSVFVS